MTNLLEALMIICFVLAWPIAIHKSWVSRTAKGRSFLFELLFWLGYALGIVRHFMLYQAHQGDGWLFYLSWFLYCLSIIEVTIDMVLYIRNFGLDRIAAKSAPAQDAAIQPAVPVQPDAVPESISEN